MRVSKEELITVLSQFNPWWRDEAIADLPKWRRAAFRELQGWLTTPPAPRAVLLSGARQIGKTTLMLQAADALLRGGVPPANILYATFDHPILKLAGTAAVLLDGRVGTDTGTTMRLTQQQLEAHLWGAANDELKGVFTVSLWCRRNSTARSIRRFRVRALPATTFHSRFRRPRCTTP